MRKVKNITISPDNTIRQALEAIDLGAMQIALIVDGENHLIGTITDGDIRRAILKGRGLSDSIDGVFNIQPTKAYINQPKEDILQLAIINGIKQVPMVDENGCLVGIEYIDDYLRKSEKPNTVILMAGGLGTRLRPLTENIPKPMLKVGTKPILETIIENFSSYGFRNFFLCVNYKAEIIMQYFGDGSRQGVNIRYIQEPTRLGTAGALSLLPELPPDPLLVMNGDLLTNINFEHLLNYHLTADAMATMCVREYDFQVPYGVVEMAGASIQAIVEKPIHNFYVNAGIYVLSPKAVSLIPKDSFFDMPELFQQLIHSEKKICSFPIKGYWLDIGRSDDFAKANTDYEEIFDV
ncbi:nucleotidyltransferase family protein [uncultured Desulfobulbus sp.]|uniref:nucleotidyltransferase family protein n=1 Tax=uncultured Desulfobulbus sp. TaxID=239745 RepID=UPI0029C8B353|nr:nucleotidyltransferase family protein [uncultured Desulfobulbus sp.]